MQDQNTESDKVETSPENPDVSDEKVVNQEDTLETRLAEAEKQAAAVSRLDYGGKRRILDAAASSRCRLHPKHGHQRPPDYYLVFDCICRGVYKKGRVENRLFSFGCFDDFRFGSRFGVFPFLHLHLFSSSICLF